MPVELRRDQLSLILPLFMNNANHSIAKSCCMGLCACHAYVDRVDRPTAAVLVLDRLGIGFVTGDTEHAEALLEAIKGMHPWFEIFDAPTSWHRYLACWSKDSFASLRYALQSSWKSFRSTNLHKMARVPDGCILVPYNHDLLREASCAEWSEDQIGAFQSEKEFLGRGFGLALIRNGELVAGCTTFCRHHDGYEVQVDTRPDMRGKGYATCVAASFILQCISLGQIPYWDAANIGSLQLALKLGYTFMGSYLTWMLITEEMPAEDVIRKVIGE